VTRSVIPGRAKREPGIHNPGLWLWIPGLRLAGHPGMTTEKEEGKNDKTHRQGRRHVCDRTDPVS
jgi:hypothetical protein